ncbi:CENP-S associating centromere protein X-domain-containing protein [Aspergillus falconensis]
MPPERKPPQKRRTLPFKPPSRASGSVALASTAGPSKAKPAKPATKTKGTPTATTSSSRTKSAKAASSRQRPSTPASATDSGTDSASSTSDDSNRASPASASDDEDGANYILAEITHAEPTHENVLSSDPLIPPKLLTKLVHHHFRNEKTKIAKDANAVVAKYIDVFVREAVARAAYERAEAQGGAGGGGGIADGFLEVEDLEKMGPQLAMDF